MLQINIPSLLLPKGDPTTHTEDTCPLCGSVGKTPPHTHPLCGRAGGTPPHTEGTRPLCKRAREDPNTHTRHTPTVWKGRVDPTTHRRYTPTMWKSRGHPTPHTHTHTHTDFCVLIIYLAALLNLGIITSVSFLGRCHGIFYIYSDVTRK